MNGTIKRRRLGRTDLMVTELSFGAMNLRLLKSFDKARQIVNHVLGRGVNLIDTARAYKGEIAPGVLLESEQVVGERIREFRVQTSAWLQGEIQTRQKQYFDAVDQKCNNALAAQLNAMQPEQLGGALVRREQEMRALGRIMPK